jgi:hypothetical protein
VLPKQGGSDNVLLVLPKQGGSDNVLLVLPKQGGSDNVLLVLTVVRKAGSTKYSIELERTNRLRTMKLIIMIC